MFYLLIMQNDSTQVVYAYETYDSALAAFHSELAYRAEGRNKTVCCILSSIGELIKREYWTRPEEPNTTNNSEE